MGGNWLSQDSFASAKTVGGWTPTGTGMPIGDSKSQTTTLLKSTLVLPPSG